MSETFNAWFAKWTETALKLSKKCSFKHEYSKVVKECSGSQETLVRIAFERVLDNIGKFQSFCGKVQSVSIREPSARRVQVALVDLFKAHLEKLKDSVLLKEQIIYSTLKSAIKSGVNNNGD